MLTIFESEIDIHQESVSKIDVHSPGVSILLPDNNIYPRYIL